MDGESHAQVMEPWAAAPAFMLNTGYFEVPPEILVDCFCQHPSVIQFRPCVEIIQAGWTVPAREPGIIPADIHKRRGHCNNPTVIILCMVDMDDPVISVNLRCQKIGNFARPHPGTIQHRHDTAHTVRKVRRGLAALCGFILFCRPEQWRHLIFCEHIGTECPACAPDNPGRDIHLSRINAFDKDEILAECPDSRQVSPCRSVVYMEAVHISKNHFWLQGDMTLRTATAVGIKKL